MLPRILLVTSICCFVLHLSVAASTDHTSYTQSQDSVDTSGLELRWENNQATTAIVFGNVKTVLDGLSTGTSFRNVDAGMFEYALGAASINADPATQGETFVMGDHAVVKQTGEQTGYATRVNSGSYSAGFLAGLPRGSKPSAKYRVDAPTSDGIEMQRIYSKLAERHKGLFAVAGSGRFDEIDASAVKRAPSYGESILGENQQKYFHRTASLRELDAVFFGIILSSSDAATSGSQLIFYINPQDKAATGVQSHTHFARVNPGTTSKTSNPASIVSDVAEVAHLLTQSRIEAGDIFLYEINGVEAR